MGEPRNSDERATCAADQCPTCHDDNLVGGWGECYDCLRARADVLRRENERLTLEKNSLSEHASHLLAERASAFVSANRAAAERDALLARAEAAEAKIAAVKAILGDAWCDEEAVQRIRDLFEPPVAQLLADEAEAAENARDWDVPMVRPSQIAAARLRDKIAEHLGEVPRTHYFGDDCDPPHEEDL